nr:hypothetical protein [Sicyoidochytrium minutum DNA virus]
MRLVGIEAVQTGPVMYD